MTGTSSSPRALSKRRASNLRFTPAQKRFEIYPLDKPVAFASPKFVCMPDGGLRYYSGCSTSRTATKMTRVHHRTGLTRGFRTIVAGLPAPESHGIPIWRSIAGRGRDASTSDRQRTNSGVVGLDDFALGWAKQHPDVHDVPTRYKERFCGTAVNSANPGALLRLRSPSRSVSGVRQQQQDSHQGLRRITPSATAPSSLPADAAICAWKCMAFACARLGFNEYSRYFTTRHELRAPAR